MRYVSKQSKTTLGVKKHTDPKFPVGCCPLIPMTMAQFWDAAKNPTKGIHFIIFYFIILYYIYHIRYEFNFMFLCRMIYF